MAHHNGKYAKKPYFTKERRKKIYLIVTVIVPVCVGAGLFGNDLGDAMISIVGIALLSTTGLALTNLKEDEVE